MDHLTTAFNSIMDVQLLKYVAGLHIFCPQCEHILDYKTVVILDVWNKHQTQYHGQQVCCTKCAKLERVPTVEKKKELKIFIKKWTKNIPI